jgi:hydrogenase expression/formation protein HypC
MCIALPVQVIELTNLTATVGRESRAFTAGRQFLPEAKAGDWVLVHAGQMVSLISADEAKAINDLLQEITVAKGEAA